MRKNLMKEKLSRGEAVIGMTLLANWPEAVEILGHLGMDYIWLDGQHGVLDLQDMANLVRAAESVNITPLARIPRIAPDIILSYLDLGVQGFICPDVETAEQAKNVVSWCKFHPEGVRGAGYGHFAEYYTLSGATKVRADANRETSVIIQIESKAGVDNLEEIVRTPGVDIIAMGPMDLSQSLGIPAQFNNPIHKAAMAKALEIVLGAGKVFGDVGWSGADARKKRAEGVRFLNYGVHDLLTAGAKQYLQEAEWSR